MSPLLLLHIIAGTISVLSGAVALIFRKGGKIHRQAGFAFVVAMIAMAITAAVVGMAELSNAGAAVVTIYMLGTSWVTIRRKEKKAGQFEVGAFAVAAVFSALGFWSVYEIATGVREPANPFIIYASMFVNGAVALAALGDLSVVLRRGVAGAQRLARHLWRMCFGLFIAVGSFSAQGIEALPPSLPRGELMLATMALVLLTMLYWLARVFLMPRRYGGADGTKT